MIALFQKIIRRLSRFKGLYTVYTVPEDPDSLTDKTVYLVGEGEFVWYGLFLCPCGCQAKIFTNFSKQTNPNWEYRINKNQTVTLSPSVWRTKGCRSHFFLREGKIIWCPSERADSALPHG